MCDFWPFFVFFSQFLYIFVVFCATRIAPVDSIAHVSSFQSRLRSLYDLWLARLVAHALILLGVAAIYGLTKVQTPLISSLVPNLGM